ncbi:: DUF1580 [Gemmata massiliana]|uniref:: DUF1580 n=1 Tax=Gemmata massiliana TaxID=1210884 RepID=A0A6P2DC27_9BACT|nr:DUF1580 domain-containing protein [Gemmata massiliana]VTR97905.1 : DUF1580 [Gemmata massiliana]
MTGFVSEHVEQVEHLEAVPVTADLVERLTREGLISMKDAAKCYKGNTHKSTVVRHAMKGVRATDGTTIRLEAIRIGGALCTSRPAILRFFAAQNAGSSSVPAAPTPAQNNRAALAAHKELAAVLGAPA